MSEVSRDVILDLLPLYLADEVSADSRKLVETYLQADPEMREIAEQSAKMTVEIPIPLKKEDQMEAYLQAQKYLFRRGIVWATLIAIALLSVIGMALVVFLTLVRYIGI